MDADWHAGGDASRDGAGQKWALQKVGPDRNCHRSLSVAPDEFESAVRSVLIQPVDCQALGDLMRDQLSDDRRQ
jgi:hypothetical protein